jgi:hypothetical protein
LLDQLVYVVARDDGSRAVVHAHDGSTRAGIRFDEAAQIARAAFRGRPALPKWAQNRGLLLRQGIVSGPPK